MNQMNDLPHRFADHCPHAGMDKACPSCRRAFGEVYRLAHIDFQEQTQAPLDASIREVQANAWDEGRASAGIHRAPKREAWQDLGDKLAVEMPGIEDEPRIEALAKALYCEHGVRVVGDDDRG